MGLAAGVMFGEDSEVLKSARVNGAPRPYKKIAFVLTPKIGRIRPDSLRHGRQPSRGSSNSEITQAEAYGVHQRTGLEQQ